MHENGPAFTVQTQFRASSFNYDMYSITYEKSKHLEMPNVDLQMRQIT